MATGTDRNSRFAPYRQALDALSKRTRTPLPSLVVSFAILHELTAVVPVVGLFFGARALGVGDRVVKAVALPAQGGDADGLAARFRGSWLGVKFKGWMDEGEIRAERVGRRYGLFGFEKGSRPSDPQAPRIAATGRIAGDVANAVVAYALTKALLPARIGLSMYLAPAFSRQLLQPVGTAVGRMFGRKPPTQ